MMQDDFYKVCFNSLSEGICITDDSGKIVMNNSSLEEIFGYDPGELLHKNIDALIPEENKKPHRIHYKNYFQSPQKRKKGKGREFLGLHKSGNVFNVEIGLNHFTYNGASYAKALVTDISSRKVNELKIKELNIALEQEVKRQTGELKKTIRKLKTSNKNLTNEIEEKIIAKNKAKIALEKEKELNLLQTKFLSLVSHEFKTPLSGILTSITLIGKYNKSNFNERVDNHINTIKNLVFQLNSVLDDFLFLEKTETKKSKYHLSRFNITKLLKEVIRKSNSVLKKGQKIALKSVDKELKVHSDKTILEIIFRNILYNAIKYSPQNSLVTIELDQGAYITVCFKDEGIGIPADDQKHIFERFFRAKNALPFQGTGIGLNIVKHHVEALHGKVSFKSKEKEGTVFKITLPLKINP